MEAAQPPDTLKDALAALHQESFGWALACCDRHVADAEDVLQAAYIKVLSGQARFEGRSSLKTWFFSIIRYTAHEVRRSRTSRAKLLLSWFTREDAGESAPATQDLDMQQGQDRARVRAALDALSEQQRRVLELVFYHDMTIEEASEVMGVNLGTARTHYARGKRQVLKALGLPDAESAEPAAAMRLTLELGV